MKRALATLAIVVAAAGAGMTQPTSSRGSLSIEQLIDIKHPSNPTWSQDGRSVSFTWDRAGVSGRYIVDVDGGAPRLLPVETTGVADGRGGRGGRGGPADALDVPSPDGALTAFVRSGELWIRAARDGEQTRLVSADGNIAGVGWSPDSAYILYTVGGGPVRHEQTPPYSGVKIIYTITENTQGRSFAVRAALNAAPPSPVEVPAGGFGQRRWLDGHRFVMDRTSSDFKRRTTYLVDVTAGESKVLNQEVEPKFWSMTGDAGGGAQPSPDGKWLAFLSDRDGWDHLYVMPVPAADGARRLQPSEPVQITKGRFEAWRPQWSPDGRRIAFDANEPDKYGTRHLYVAHIDGNPARATVAALTTGRGTDIAPQWSPDGTRVVYQHTDPENSADLFVVDVPDASLARQTFGISRRLTTSMPYSIDKSQLVAPEIVHYQGPDGQQVPAWLFVPKGIDRTAKHPAIVWVHGDGVNQNYDGWHVQRNYAVYYSFHQYLLQKGYIVIAPDYRGSIGYGRAWREGVYMDVGGKDAKDAWMAASYLKTLPYVDADRIGIWGLSYGGFFTLIAMTDQPKLFRAGVDVAGVVDYAMYYEDPYHGGWTTSRIGTPEQNPQVYADASPLSHVDQLERPLLVLHGTADVNVPYLHSVRLVDELMKKGKDHLLSFMMYPGEFHYFTREHVLRDAWNRVDEFFDTHLKGETARRVQTAGR